MLPVVSSIVTSDSGPQQIRVLLADDSGVMLRAVSRLLNAHPEVSLVGAVGIPMKPISIPN
jgi:hypothetical protein